MGRTTGNESGAAILRSGDEHGHLLALDVPVLPDVLPILSDEEGIGSLPLVAQVRPLLVDIPVWDDYEVYFKNLIDLGYDPVSVFEVLWDDNPIPGLDPLAVMLEANPDSVFPVRLEVPSFELLTEGIHTVSYRQWIRDIGNVQDSPPVSLRLDKTAPNQGNPCPLQGPDKNISVIDQAYLDGNGGRATFFLERWLDIRLEDQVLLYLMADSEPFEPLALQAIDIANKPEDPIAAHIPASVLSSGSFSLFCRLRDRSGNLGPRSSYLPLRISLGGGVVLPAPVVPLALDGLVNLDDARQPVQVQIPFIEQALPGDILQVYWNGRPLQPFTVRPGQNWPVDIPVPWAVITADGFAGPVTRDVFYEGIRQGAPLKSPVIQVPLDLRVAGPEPEKPDPLNPLLSPVTVKGLEADNELGFDDLDKPVTVQVRLYDQPQPGQRLELYWGEGGGIVSTYVVKLGDKAGDLVTFPLVDFADVRKAGFGPAVPVFYWTSNGINRQRAADTPVSVLGDRMADYLPLDGTPPDVSLWGWINCESFFPQNSAPRSSLVLRVPNGQPLLVKGDRIQLSWQMCSDQTGNKPISAATYLPAVTYDASGGDQGFELHMRESERLVYEELKKTGNWRGSVRAGYRVRKADGRWGEAEPAIFGVDIGLASGVVCKGASALWPVQ